MPESNSIPLLVESKLTGNLGHKNDSFSKKRDAIAVPKQGANILDGEWYLRWALHLWDLADSSRLQGNVRMDILVRLGRASA